MAKDQTEVGITGKPVPKPRTAKQQYELEKKRRMEKHLGTNVGGTQYSSGKKYYVPSTSGTNPRARTFREFLEIAEGVADKAKEAVRHQRQGTYGDAHEIDKLQSATDASISRMKKKTSAYPGGFPAVKKEETEIDEAKVEAGMTPDEKRRIRTGRSGFTNRTPAYKGGHTVADYERRGAHKERDELNKDAKSIRKGKLDQPQFQGKTGQERIAAVKKAKGMK